MSVPTTQSVAVEPQHQIRGHQRASSDMSNLRQEIHSDGVVQERIDDSAQGESLHQDISPATFRPQGKEINNQDLNSPIIEESTEARLERLGRQRPEVFDSIWSEIGFVFSIAMSQVLSVSPIRDRLMINISTDPR